jgi:hypothetical protein
MVLLLAAVVAVAGAEAERQDAPPDHDTDSEAAQVLKAGQEAFGLEQYRRAAKRFSAADEMSNGLSWEALAGLTSSWIQLEDYGRAEKAGRRLLQLEQSREQLGVANQLLGIALTGSGQLEEAEIALLKALGLRTGRPFSTLKALALVLCRQERFDEALPLLNDTGRCSHEKGSSETADEAGGSMRVGAESGPTSPVKISGRSPAVPKSAGISRVEGKVVLDTVIGTDGLVKCVRIVDSVSPALSCSAALTVLEWKFQPSVFEGEPVEIRYILTISFEL